MFIAIWASNGLIVMSGSVINHSWQQCKINGIVTWHFDLIAECLPLIVQATLLLNYTLSNYLSFINKVVTSVIISFTPFSLLFYLLIVSATIPSYNCLFQIPASPILYFLFNFDNKYKKCLKRTKKWSECIFSQKNEKLLRLKSHSPYGLGKSGIFNGRSPSDHIELPIASLDQPSPLFNEETNWNGTSTILSGCSRLSVDLDVIGTIMRFIPKVVWSIAIWTTQLEWLYNMVLECFNCLSRHPVVIPKLWNKTYLGTNALLHPS